MVLLERGGRLPSRTLDQSAPQRVFITQQAAESAGELVERTAARLSELDTTGRGIGFALLACGGSSDGSTASARAKLADVILAHLSRARRAHLVLTAGGRAGAHLRHDLVSLADRALTQMRARGGTVSIWFSDDDGKSDDCSRGRRRVPPREDARCDRVLMRTVSEQVNRASA